jgi:DICT domain-containing protein
MPETAELTIGELARRTGVNVATLRMWEQRHGFPQAQRLPSGHRRYSRRSVEDVLRVKRRREAGVRLEAAVAEVTAAELTPGVPSVYAGLRRQHPALSAHRLRKQTLLALTWALEDECCARAQQAWLLGAFQHERFYRRAERRWRDLSRTARGSWVMATFEEPTERKPDETAPVEVPLPDTALMVREWVLICVAPEFPAVLAAWELPGQESVTDMDRVFESVWSLDPRATLDAARVFTGVMDGLGQDTAVLRRELDRLPALSVEEVQHATNCFTRVLGYLERLN